MLARQGDLIIKTTGSVPKSAKKQTHLTVEEGEVTGHFHRLSGGTLFKTPTKDYFTAQKPVELVHDEHDTITFPPGTYEVTRQREYTPQRNERVLD